MLERRDWTTVELPHENGTFIETVGRIVGRPMSNESKKVEEICIQAPQLTGAEVQNDLHERCAPSSKSRTKTVWAAGEELVDLHTEHNGRVRMDVDEEPTGMTGVKSRGSKRNSSWP
uniref:DUF5641 domain-containing protein n=1 Tax=Haemonchus contortus TaxID=6289 RepID=A0A7I4Y6F9_HAECO